MQALRPKEADSQILMEKLLAYDLLLLSVLGLLSARDIAYFLSTSMSISDHFDIKKVCKYLMNHQRTKTLLTLRRTGDIPVRMLENKVALNSLERLHFLENPPRFPVTLFNFGVESLVAAECEKLRVVANLLLRHERLVVRIEGRAQPDAPTWIVPVLSYKRAKSACAAITNFMVKDRKEGESMAQVRVRAKRSIRCVGMGCKPLVNGNFDSVEQFKNRNEALMQEPRTQDNYEQLAQLWRRCDITVLGLQGEDEIEEEQPISIDGGTLAAYSQLQAQMHLNHMQAAMEADEDPSQHAAMGAAEMQEMWDS